MKIIKFLILFIFITTLTSNIYSQGRNHNWLIGYTIALFDSNVTATKGRIILDSNSVSVLSETRKMAFRATQGNISDENGNLLIVSNGCWIANATGDTMLNGGGLNPGNLGGWCNNSSGLPLPHGNVILPFPGDSNKYILFHQTEYKLFYSLIDMTLDGGLGGVTQKNVMVLQDTLNWGFSACKHANGRDWWIVALKDNSNLLYKVLLTPDTIASVTSQNLNFPNIYANGGEPTFSPDGTKFAYTYGYTGPNGKHDVRILNFDRCNGNFDSLMFIPLRPGAGFGLAFSPNSNFLYHSSFQKIYQINLTNLSEDTVAINDGYYSPYPPFQTDFWTMYLAANGKIYISSGNGVIDMHVINSPDLQGIACDVQQHSLHTPCFFVRSDVLHPNYYLGPVLGSVCDTLGLGIEDIDYNFHYSIGPNPNSGVFSITYLLPQNLSGYFQVFDLNGRVVYNQNLSPWSSLQTISLPESVASGVYDCMISSGGYNTHLKVAIVKL